MSTVWEDTLGGVGEAPVVGLYQWCARVPVQELESLSACFCSISMSSPGCVWGGI